MGCFLSLVVTQWLNNLTLNKATHNKVDIHNNRAILSKEVTRNKVVTHSREDIPSSNLILSKEAIHNKAIPSSHTRSRVATHSKGAIHSKEVTHSKEDTVSLNRMASLSLMASHRCKRHTGSHQ